MVVDLASVWGVKTVRCTCYACPDQWEGQLIDGTYFYFRYRWGCASLGFSNESPFEAVDDPHTVYIDHGGAFDGVFESDAERIDVFTRLLRKRLELHG